MTNLWVFLGGVATAASLLFVTEATTGVWLVCVGCFFGICARLAQADSSDKKREALLKDLLGRLDGGVGVRPIKKAPPKPDN